MAAPSGAAGAGVHAVPRHQAVPLNPRLILRASDGVGIVVSFQSSSSLCAVLLLRVLELLDLLLESGYLSLRLSLCSAQDLFFFKDARNPRTSSSSDEHLSQ